MRARTHDRAIFALTIPALGTLAADPLVSLIDTAFVGRLGPLPLAALGVNVAVFTFVFVALQDFGFLAVAMLLSAAVGAALLGAVLPLGWGLPGVWWALVGLMVTRAATMGWCYRPAARTFERRG